MFKTKKQYCRILTAQLLCALAVFSMSPAAHADTLNYVSPYALEQALGTDKHVDLYGQDNKKGFNLSSAYFSGYASGLSKSDDIATLTDDQSLYAMLVDGRYDFNYEASSLSSLHPYLSGGVGVATLGHGGSSGFDAQSGNAVPLLRFGGGVAYRLDPQWNLSLDYKAGRAELSSGDQVFTGRSQQQVDLQELNLGMSYAF